MDYNGRHRNADPPGSLLPRRAVLLGGGILATGAAFGVVGTLGSSPERSARQASATPDEASREDSPRASRKSRKPGKSATAPLIHATERWGAREAERTATVKSGPKYIVVHHTFTDNVDDYSLAQAQRLARSIQNVHMDQGWGDTGQQFTISRGGHVLEGRTGSLAAARDGEMVVGTHVAGANDFSVGIECEGTYNTVMPPRRLLASLVRMCAWLSVQYDLNPHEAIVPHMKFNDTDCCGYKFAPTLPRLRDEVAKAVPAKLLA
ncbi:hypothetical protein GCM10010191_49280 [Actinomadura vinacea]|uniref:N-acetylmuramoyl-L-alanine amidase n=1 Tax=Actinomadura vinacea TaxID=115336 RepID=A0ABN3JJS2_9ACTN